MRKRSSIWSHWLKYLIRRDNVSKVVLLVAIAEIGLWFALLKDSVTPLVPAGSIGAAIAFSFLSYVFVGLPRMATETKLYDSIASDCKFPWKHEGRSLGRIKVEWGFLLAKKVTVQADIASSAVTSANTWRTMRSAVSDAFSGGRQNYITVFDEHDRGTLVFLLPGASKDPALDEKYRNIEDLTSFVYDSLHKYGNSLPRIKDLTMGFENNEELPHSFNVSLPYQADSYTKKNFERDFRQKYENGNALWVFKWSGLGVEVSHILRGTEAERKQYVTKSITDLLASSYRSAFHYGDNDYIFTQEMIGWDGEGNPERLTIDFLHTDVSSPDKQESFEKRVTQGLHQIFKTPYWDFKWTVSSYEKILTIQRIESSAEENNEVTGQPLDLQEVMQPVVPMEVVQTPEEPDLSPVTLIAEPTAVIRPAKTVSTPDPAAVPARTRTLTTPVRKMPQPPARPQMVRPPSKP